MPGTGDALTQLLAALKKRSGLSYSDLGRKSHISSSTLHRYCTGTTVPPDYQTVVSIATACKATDTDLVDLLRHWRVATGQADVQDFSDQSFSFGWKRPRFLTGAAAAFIAVMVLATMAASNTQSRSRTAQWIDGPAWQREQMVDPSMFGVTASSSSGSMPAFRVGSVRFRDSRTSWAGLQPQPDVYDWSILDRLVGGAAQAGLPAMLVFGGTPAWAAPSGEKAPYDDGSRSAPPDDLAVWERFVSTLVTRYRGRIEAYELWVNANDPRYYSGSTEILVEMTRRASRAIRAIDTKAVVVCPSIARLWTHEGRAVLHRFAELRGYDHCDVAGLKLHQRQAADPPETMIDLLQQTDGALHDAGIHPRLWNTGVTYEYARDERLDEQRAINYATRFYLVAIYGKNFGLDRAYFYNWGGARLPIALQAVGGPPTRAALAVEELQRWLSRTTTRSCGQGLAINLPGNVWQCEFTAKDGRLLTIRWTHGGTATTTATAQIEEIRHIDGTNRHLQVGDTVQISEAPVLLVHRQP